MLHSYVFIHTHSAAFYLFWLINTTSYWIYNVIYIVVAEIKNDYLIYIFEKHAHTHLIHLQFAQLALHNISTVLTISFPNSFEKIATIWMVF